MAGERRVAEVMQKICDVAAQAVCRYCDVAGQIASKGAAALFMRESFLAAFVLDRLGNSLTISLETNYRDLEDFCGLPKGRLGRNQRVDMVVYTSDSSEKERQRPTLLVEFKLLRSFTEDNRDRAKLLEIFQRLNQRLHGAVCAVVDPSKVDLSKERAAAKDKRDR